MCARGGKVCYLLLGFAVLLFVFRFSLSLFFVLISGWRCGSATRVCLFVLGALGGGSPCCLFKSFKFIDVRK